MRVLDATFLTSAAEKHGWPDETLAEIAFAGRSNVGKSSLLNALTMRRNLARVSGKPGRTRLLNFFKVRTDECDFILVDLPGYGYARVSKAEQKKWGPMVEKYLSQRAQLRLVVILVDARRGPEDEELRLASYLRSHRIGFIVVATKIDKLSRTRRGGATQSITRAFGLQPSNVIPFSSLTGTGRDALLTKISGVCCTPTHYYTE